MALTTPWRKPTEGSSPIAGLWLQALKRIPNPIYVTDLSPDRMALVFANDAFGSCMGAQTPEALVGRPLISLFHPDQGKDRPLDYVLSEFAPGLEAKGWHKAAVVFRTLDGAAIEVEVHVVAMTFEGRPYGLVQVDDVAHAVATQERKRQLNALADLFETKVGRIVANVAETTARLSDVATAVSTTARNTTALSMSAAAAAEDTRGNVVVVSSATEELGSSIEEISRQASSSAAMARVTADSASQSVALIDQLERASRRIGDMVGMIETIAKQTNLLALNATIEAARAGDAGTGFAVVAGEVKALAGQTARATHEIGDQIGRIQSVSSQAGQAMDEIVGRIREISGAADAIATAVSRQDTATREIAGNAVQAASRTSDVTVGILGVSRATQQTEVAISDVLGSVRDLSAQSADLTIEVQRFLQTVRAA